MGGTKPTDGSYLFRNPHRNPTGCAFRRNDVSVKRERTTSMKTRRYQNAAIDRKHLDPPLPRRKNSLVYHIIPPQVVDLPHPDAALYEISVPASINGNDLSKGRP